MAHWKWDSTFSVGISAIDEQHKRIIDYINDLYFAGIHRYFGRQFIDALTDNGFSVSPSFDDQYPYTLSLTDLQSVVNAVRKLIADCKDGHYALTWVSTKGLPF